MLGQYSELFCIQFIHGRTRSLVSFSILCRTSVSTSRHPYIVQHLEEYIEGPAWDENSPPKGGTSTLETNPADVLFFCTFSLCFSKELVLVTTTTWRFQIRQLYRIDGGGIDFFKIRKRLIPLQPSFEGKKLHFSIGFNGSTNCRNP